MIYYTKRIFISLVCFTFVLLSVNVKAQGSLVQNLIDKIDGYKNFSYQSINKMKELFTDDTIMTHYKSLFIKAPKDENFGHFFNIETRDDNKKVTDLYNGQNQIHIIPKNRTYEIQKDFSFNMQSTLPGCLQLVPERLQNQSSKILQAKDTTINQFNCHHLIATVWDTIIDNERNYTAIHLFINERTDLPDVIIITSRNTTYGNGISNYYSETRYFNYKINQGNIDITSIAIPKGFHPQKDQPVLPKKHPDLLPVSSVAPDWTLYDSEGKKMSLSKMKGRVVLMDFFFIGCFPCLQALKPLNKLHEKYKNENVAMLSMTFRDSKKSVTEFEKIYNIKYPIYINAGEVNKLYNVKSFPTFYIIDKKGKIANVFIGCDDDFEKKVTLIIDKLLKE